MRPTTWTVAPALARLALAVGALAALGACGTRMATIDTGAPLSDADLAMGWSKPENRAADDFSEQIVVRGLLADGATFYAKLTVTNLASADGRADLTVNVELADKRKLRFRTRKDRDDWTWEKDHFHAEVGDGMIELGVGRAKIICKTDDFELEARVVSTLPPVRPAGGFVKRAAGYYLTTVPIPRGEITISLIVHTMPELPEGEDDDGEPNGEAPDSQAGAPAAPAAAPVVDGGEAAEVAEVDEDDGPTELELDGVAYVEHRVGTLTPFGLAHRWHNVIDLGEEQTVVFSAFEQAQTKAEKGRVEPVVQGWMLAADDDGLLIYEPELRLWVRDWTSDDKTSYPLPGLVFVSDPERRTFEGVVKPGPLSVRKDDLSGLKKLERLVVRRFMKPWTFRYERARYLFRKQELAQPMTEVRGDATYLYQQLND